MRIARFLLTGLVVITQLQCDAESKKKQSSGDIPRDFVINANRPFVYVQLDHVGAGPRLSEDEPKTRIWLRLVNNSRVPIIIYAFGLPDEWPKNEVGVIHEVVPDAEDGLGKEPIIVPFGIPMSEGEKQALAKSESETMPGGYGGDAFSTVRIPPGKSILFSLPINHLGRRKTKGKNWHTEIPFKFDLPAGKGPRNPLVGGEPYMVIRYSIFDLPSQVDAEPGK